MKTSKKVLGIVLAIAMLLNVFAVCAFAAFPDDSVVKLIITPDKASYAAGDEVVFTVSEQVIASVGDMTIGGQYEFAYNSAGLEPISAGFDAVADHAFTPNTVIAGNGTSTGYDNAASQVIFDDANSMVDADGATAHNWDKLISFSIGEFNDGRISAAAKDAPLQVFTFKMKVPAGAADGEYSIGFNKYGYDNYVAYSNDLVNMGLYGNDGSSFEKTNMYDCGTCTITVGAAVTTPSVANGTTQVQWADKDAGKMNIAFRGIISDVDLTYAQGSTKELANITEVGVLFSKTDSELELSDVGTTAAKVESQSIYDYETGTYFYRAIVENVAYDNAETLYFRAYIVVDGTTYLAPATESTTATAQYTRATAAGMEAFGA